MIDEDKHIFEETLVPPDLQDTFLRRFECKRCKLEKLMSRKGVTIYSRSRIMFSEPPLCFGSVPINEQILDR